MPPKRSLPPRPTVARARACTRRQAGRTRPASQELSDSSLTADSQQRRTARAARADRGIEEPHRATTKRIRRDPGAAEQQRSARSRHGQARRGTRHRENLSARVGELERPAHCADEEAELGRRVTELDSRLDEQSQFPRRARIRCRRLRNEAAADENDGIELRAARAEPTTSEIETHAISRMSRSRAAQASQDERAKLQREIAAMKQRGGENMGQ